MGWTDASWPADVPAWPVHYGESLTAEETLQQSPMIASQEPEAEPRTDREVEVPSQVRMESMQAHPETTMQAQRRTTPTTHAATLRHRRGQENSAQDSVMHAANVQEADTDAQARELANGLLGQIQAGGEARWAAMASFERLAFGNTVSSRAAQMVLEEASMNDAVALAAGLRGHVRNAVLSKHANHVVQKITEVMPVARASFVVSELKGFANDVARHVFGCRVLCRILEHLSPNDSSTIELVEEISVGLEELCSHPYGSYVVRHLLEFGLTEHRQHVVKALLTDLAGYTKHKFGSHVVEVALRHASLEDRQVMARELLADKEQLMVLAANQFGRFTIRALLAQPENLKQEALDVLRPMESQLKASRYGKSVLSEVRKAASA